MSFEQVVRELPKSSQIAASLDQYFKPLYPLLPEREMGKAINTSILRTMHVFATSEYLYADGQVDREREFFREKPIDDQAEFVGNLLKRFNPNLATAASALLEDSSEANSTRLLQEAALGSFRLGAITHSLSVPWDKTDNDSAALIGTRDSYLVALGNSSLEERQAGFRPIERLFLEHFDHRAWGGINTAWFPDNLVSDNYIQQPEGDQIEIVESVANILLKDRITQLTPIGLSENQLIGLGALSYADGINITSTAAITVLEAQWDYEAKPLVNQIAVHLEGLVRNLFNDPRISDPVVITSEEIQKVIRDEVCLDGINYSFRSETEGTEETEEIDWNKAMDRLLKLPPDVVKEFDLSLGFANELAQYAKTGQMEREDSQKFRDWLYQFYFDNEPKSKDNNSLIIETGLYLFNQMIADNLKKMQEENEDPLARADWDWYLWADEVLDDSMTSAFNITKRIESRIA